MKKLKILGTKTCLCKKNNYISQQFLISKKLKSSPENFAGYEKFFEN